MWRCGGPRWCRTAAAKDSQSSGSGSGQTPGCGLRRRRRLPRVPPSSSRCRGPPMMPRAVSRGPPRRSPGRGMLQDRAHPLCPPLPAQPVSPEEPSRTTPMRRMSSRNLRQHVRAGGCRCPSPSEVRGHLPFHRRTGRGSSIIDGRSGRRLIHHQLYW